MFLISPKSNYKKASQKTGISNSDSSYVFYPVWVVTPTEIKQSVQ